MVRVIAVEGAAVVSRRVAGVSSGSTLLTHLCPAVECHCPGQLSVEGGTAGFDHFEPDATNHTTRNSTAILARQEEGFTVRGLGTETKQDIVTVFPLQGVFG